jgi:hypothetical protein
LSGRLDASGLSNLACPSLPLRPSVHMPPIHRKLEQKPTKETKQCNGKFFVEPTCCVHRNSLARRAGEPVQAPGEEQSLPESAPQVCRVWPALRCLRDLLFKCLPSIENLNRSQRRKRSNATRNVFVKPTVCVHRSSLARRAGEPVQAPCGELSGPIGALGVWTLVCPSLPL